MNPLIITLAFGNFMIGTGALLVSGMLPALADGLAVPITQAAFLIPAFAMAVCLTAPFLASATARFERRSLLVAVLLIYSITHAGAALVSNLEAMSGMRVLSGVASALFTPQAAATAAQLMPPERRASTMAGVFMGWATAAVVGMPLGAFIGAEIGWRTGYMLVAIGSLIAALAVFLVVPKGLRTQVAGLEMWKQLLGHWPLILAILVTAVQSTGQFVAFSLLVPAFKHMGNATTAQVSMLLAVYGITGVIGSYLAGRAADRFGAQRIVVIACLSVFTGMVLWRLGQGSLMWLIIMQMFWGFGGFAINSTQQGRLANMAPGLAPVSIALNTSCIYLGQAIGTPIGVAVLHQFAAQGASEAGFKWLGPIGAPFLIAAIALSLFAQRLVARRQFELGPGTSRSN